MKLIEGGNVMKFGKRNYLEIYRVANGRAWVREIEDIKKFVYKEKEEENGRETYQNMPHYVFPKSSRLL